MYHISNEILLRKSKQVFSATTRGNIVVWLANGGGEAAVPKWKPTRLLRLEEVSCGWWRAGHVTTMLTPDWLQDGISAVAERDGFIAVADTGGRVTFFSEDLQVNDGQIFLSVSNIFTCSG